MDWSSHGPWLILKPVVSNQEILQSIDQSGLIDELRLVSIHKIEDMDESQDEDLHALQP